MNFRVKIVVWVVVMIGIFMANQYVLTTVSPSVAMDAALQQMEGIALHDTGFTFQDMLKNYLVYFMYAGWTVGMFWKEIWNCPCLKELSDE